MGLGEDNYYASVSFIIIMWKPIKYTCNERCVEIDGRSEKFRGLKNPGEVSLSVTIKVHTTLI